MQEEGLAKKKKGLDKKKDVLFWLKPGLACIQTAIVYLSRILWFVDQQSGKPEFVSVIIVIIFPIFILLGITLLTWYEYIINKKIIGIDKEISKETNNIYITFYKCISRGFQYVNLNFHKTIKNEFTINKYVSSAFSNEEALIINVLDAIQVTLKDLYADIGLRNDIQVVLSSAGSPVWCSKGEQGIDDLTNEEIAKAQEDEYKSNLNVTKMDLKFYHIMKYGAKTTQLVVRVFAGIEGPIAIKEHELKHNFNNVLEEYKPLIFNAYEAWQSTQRKYTAS